MKKAFLALLLVLTCFTALSADESIAVTFVNNTGKNISRIDLVYGDKEFNVKYYASYFARLFGESVKDGTYLGIGGTETITFTVPVNGRRYELVYYDTDGTKSTLSDVLVSNSGRIALGSSPGSTASSASGGESMPLFAFVNNTGKNISRITLEYSETSGNVTGTYVVNYPLDPYSRPGWTTTITLPEPIRVRNRYDVELEFTDGSTSKMSGVSVSDKGRVVLGSSSSSGSGGYAGWSGASLNPSTCAICGGRGQVQQLNPMYGMGSANAIRGGYSNTTPMYTMGACWMCKGAGTFTWDGVDRLGGGSSGGGGSSSGGGGSSGSGSSGGSRTRTCELCLGSGKLWELISNVASDPRTTIYCSVSGCDVHSPHRHYPCNRCNGNGKISL
jgi:hypothetical protein